MLMPRKPPKGFRKPHHPSRSGKAKGGTRVSFGEFGIQALEPAYVTNRQIEAARIASLPTFRSKKFPLNTKTSSIARRSSSAGSPSIAPRC